MDWLMYVGVTLGLSLLWLVSTFAASAMPTLQNKRITLLIAHPDDEAMFFAPTVLGLSNAKLNNHVNILCLSSGNAEGLGHIRKQELVKSGLLLGLSSATDVEVIDDDRRFLDSMKATWPPTEIIQLLSQHIDDTKTDTVITFDSHGISSHPNHMSLYHAMVDYLQERGQPIAVYTLTTTNTLRKYGSLLDAPFTILRVVLDRFFQTAQAKSNRLVFISGAKQYAQARKAMTQAHKSQMVWFRYGWIGLSRYMVVNDLKLMDTKKNI